MPAKRGNESTDANDALQLDGSRSCSFTVNRRIYGTDALLGTAYAFLDRCYILLDVADRDHYKVTLWAKPYGVQSLDELAGEFMNELVNEALRYRIAKQTERTREMVIARAIGHSIPVEAPQQDSKAPLEDLPPEVARILEEEDDSLDFLEDPLGIAVPWEEKFGKKKTDGESTDDGDLGPGSSEET